MKPIFYLPVELIFHILCIYRKSEDRSAQAVRSALRKRGLQSLLFQPRETRQPIARISFWVRLCQAASLLDETLTPTLLVEEWLGWPLDTQMKHLIEAWVRVPLNEKFQRSRADLLRRIQLGMTLSATQRDELSGLHSLGICEGERWSELGFYLFQTGERHSESFAVPLPGLWQLVDGQINVPFPPDWKLVWELERFLDPQAAWVYLLNKETLRLAVQRGALQGRPSLPDIVKLGAGEPISDALLHLLEEEPVIHLVRGFVLEFTHSEELKELRRSKFLRRHFDYLLSPRHVVLDPWQGYAILRRLCRLGLLSEQDLLNANPPGYPVSGSVIQFTRADLAYLFSILLIIEALQTTAVPPPGLLSKLAGGIDHPLRASAARKATAALMQIRPEPEWKRDDDVPPIPADALILALQSAIDHDETIDVLYQASGRHTPEFRHLTPLLLENRGERYYLIAYCHMRRANRTFRLDRLKLLEK